MSGTDVCKRSSSSQLTTGGEFYGLSGPVSRSGSTPLDISRLTLPTKEALAGEIGGNFLPEGDALPRWYNMSLVKKMPMFPHPEGVVDFCSKPLCEPLYINKKKIDFDLSDPNNYCIDTEYKSLNDPYLKGYYKLPCHMQQLKKNGELTPEGRVRCTLAEFNKYRRWLKHVGMLEYQKMREDEKKKEMNLNKSLSEPSDYLEVVVIDAQLHELEVRQRKEDQEESKDNQTMDSMLGLERQLITADKLRSERNSVDTGRIKEKRNNRKTTYDRAMALDRKRKKDKLHQYQNKLKKHLQYLKLVEDNRVDDTEKIRTDWARTKDYQRQYEDTVHQRYEKNEEKAERYRLLMDLEMNRRWQLQAGKIKERRDKAKYKQNALEETYARNIANAFSTSPRINPESVNRAVAAIEAPPESLAIEMGSMSEPPSGTLDELNQPKVPAFKTVHSKGHHRSGSLPGFDQPLQSMGVNVRLHDIDEKSAEDSRKKSKTLSDLQKRVSGESVARLPGVKKKRVRHSQPTVVPIQTKGKHAYPTKTRQLSGDEHFDEEVCIFQPQELIERGRYEDMTSEMFDEFPGETSTLFSHAEAAKRRGTIEGMTREERDALEELLRRLLRDLITGTLDMEDLINLAAICAVMTDFQLKEDKPTSTTSLVASYLYHHNMGSQVPSLVDVSGASAASSSVSGLDGFLTQTVQKAVQDQDNADDSFGNMLVEDIIKNTVCQMANDLRDGVLSREDVREIGSAVASVVLGEVRSDSSLLAESVVIPTLQQLLRDAEEIDEVLLDQTMASLLATYNQVTRRTDRMVWQVIKDFVVEVLLRTKSALIKGTLDKGEFLLATDLCRKSPIHDELELPCEHELVKVMTTAITKLAGVHRLSPVLCDLMRIILNQGQSTLVERHGADKLALPKIDSNILLQLGESACGVEVALEVAATVSDGLYRDMLIDSRFEDSLRMSMAPAFFFVLLSCWGEMMAVVDKESIALQTTSKDVEFTPTVAESLLLQSMCMLQRNVIILDELSDAVITLLALQIAEFPTLIPLSAVVDMDDNGRVRLPLYIIKKIQRLSSNVSAGKLDPNEVKKLMAMVLQIYIREVLTKQPTPVPSLSPEIQTEVREHVRSLVTNLLHKALEDVQEQVWDKLTPLENVETVVGMTQVKQVLQLMADSAVHDLRRSVKLGISPSDGGETQLIDVIHATAKVDPERHKQWPTYSIPEFLMIVLQVIESQDKEHVRCNIKKESTLRVVELIRIELGAMAREIVGFFSGMAILQQQQLMEPCPLLHKMLTFLISLLMELKYALQKAVLPLSVTYDFLHSVAKEICGPEAKNNASELDRVITTIVQDIEWKRDKSFYFKRLTKTLSQLSLDKDKEEVAESMAATAHMLSNVNPSILTQFIQTTLLSLLNTIRMPTGSPEPPKKGDDETNNQATLDSNRVTPTHPPPEGSQSKDVQGASMGDSELDLVRKKQALQTSLAKATEIRHEADIIAHIAIQTMLKRLNAEVTSPSVPAVTDETVHDLEELDEAAYTEQFKNFDPSLARYARSIVMGINQIIEFEDDRVEAEDLATTILNKTFSSIESGIYSGKLQLLLTNTSSSDTGASMGTSVGAQLTGFVKSTFNAIRSELDALHRRTGNQPEEEGTRTPSEDSQTFIEAINIVDYIINRVEEDTNLGKVKWALTRDQKLRVVFLPKSTKAFSEDKVFKTFREVMIDMLAQNQFFCPDNNPDSTHTNVTFMPCLPFLLDEFILTNLLQVADRLNNYEKEEEYLSVLSIEAIVVAMTFHQVIKDMIVKTPLVDQASEAEVEKSIRRQVVLEVLDNGIREVLDFEPETQFATNFLADEQSRKQPSTDQAEHTESQRPSNQVKCDLAKLLFSIGNLNEAARQKVSSSIILQDDQIVLDMVLDALQSILVCVIDNTVQEEVLNDLCEVLFTGASSLDPKPKRQKAVQRELKMLLEAVHEGKIPMEILKETADYLHCLEPDQRGDPRIIGQLVKNLTTSSTCVGPDCLKRAIQDLLLGLQTTGGRPRGTVHMDGTLDSCSSRDLVPEKRASSLNRTSLLNARTVSKMNVGDKGLNREESQNTVYCAHTHVGLSSSFDNIEEEAETNGMSYGSSSEDLPGYLQDDGVHETVLEKRTSLSSRNINMLTSEPISTSLGGYLQDDGVPEIVLEKCTSFSSRNINMLTSEPISKSLGEAETISTPQDSTKVTGQYSDSLSQDDYLHYDDVPETDPEKRTSLASKNISRLTNESICTSLGEAKTISTLLGIIKAPGQDSDTLSQAGYLYYDDVPETDSERRTSLSSKNINRESISMSLGGIDPESQAISGEAMDIRSNDLPVDKVASDNSRNGAAEKPNENWNRSAAGGLRKDLISRIDDLQGAVDLKARNSNSNREADCELKASYQRLFQYLAAQDRGGTEKRDSRATPKPSTIPVERACQTDSHNNRKTPLHHGTVPPHGMSTTSAMQQSTYRNRYGSKTHTTMKMTSERQEKGKTVRVKRCGSFTLQQFSLNFNDGYKPKPKKVTNPYIQDLRRQTSSDRSGYLSDKELRAQQRAFLTGYSLWDTRFQNLVYSGRQQYVVTKSPPVMRQHVEHNTNAVQSDSDALSEALEKHPYIPHPPSEGCIPKTTNRCRSRDGADDFAANPSSMELKSRPLLGKSLHPRVSSVAGAPGSCRRVERRSEQLKSTQKEDEEAQNVDIDDTHTAIREYLYDKSFESNASRHRAAFARSQKKKRAGETRKEVRFCPSVKQSSPRPPPQPIQFVQKLVDLASKRLSSCTPAVQAHLAQQLGGLKRGSEGEGILTSYYESRPKLRGATQTSHHFKEPGQYPQNFFSLDRFKAANSKCPKGKCLSQTLEVEAELTPIQSLPNAAGHTRLVKQRSRANHSTCVQLVSIQPTSAKLAASLPTPGNKTDKLRLPSEVLQSSSQVQTPQPPLANKVYCPTLPMMKTSSDRTWHAAEASATPSPPLEIFQSTEAGRTRGHKGISPAERRFIAARLKAGSDTDVKTRLSQLDTRRTVGRQE